MVVLFINFYTIYAWSLIEAARVPNSSLTLFSFLTTLRISILFTDIHDVLPVLMAI